MTHKPLVSFVVLCYNHGRFVRQCLESILGQMGGFDFEVIFVDDASTDDSQAVARSFTDPRLRFIFHENNQGHIATVTDGLKSARGEYIARIDSDDRYRPHFLSETLPVFKKYPEVGLVYGNVALMNDEGEITVAEAASMHDAPYGKGNVLCRLLEGNFICSPTVIARRDAWLKALPVPAGLAFHDWYFTTMIARAHEFYFVPSVLADYRIHAGNMHAQISRDKTEEASIFRVLQLIFSERDQTPTLEEQKRRSRKRIYGAQYLDMANKYFGHKHQADARRCYLQALRHRPGYFFRFDVLRRLLATFIGLQRYESSKSLLRHRFLPSPGGRD